MVKFRFESVNNKQISVLCKETSVLSGSSCFTLHKYG
jgi:hypothetical protein